MLLEARIIRLLRKAYKKLRLLMYNNEINEMNISSGLLNL